MYIAVLNTFLCDPGRGRMVFSSNNCYKHLNPPDSFYKPGIALFGFYEKLAFES